MIILTGERLSGKQGEVAIERRTGGPRDFASMVMKSEQFDNLLEQNKRDCDERDPKKRIDFPFSVLPQSQLQFCRTHFFFCFSLCFVRERERVVFVFLRLLYWALCNYSG